MSCRTFGPKRRAAAGTRGIREEGSVICLRSCAHATDNPMLPIRFCCRLLRPTGRTIDIRMLIPQETGSFVKFAPSCDASPSIYFPRRNKQPFPRDEWRCADPTPERRIDFAKNVPRSAWEHCRQSSRRAFLLHILFRTSSTKQPSHFELFIQVRPRSIQRFIFSIK